MNFFLDFFMVHRSFLIQSVRLGKLHESDFLFSDENEPVFVPHSGHAFAGQDLFLEVDRDCLLCQRHCLRVVAEDVERVLR